MVAERVRRLGLSPTLKVSAMAKEMRAAGIDVLDFSAGQPDFPTPDDVKQAGKQAIDDDQTRYTANEGTIELRRAIVETIEREHGLSYSPQQVLVSSGAKASLYFACMALLDPGDEVLVPLPYWVSYPEQVRLAQAEPVFVHCDESTGFKLELDALRSAVTPKTKAILLNYPSNPTGACYTREELVPLADFCVREGLWVIADEIYSRLLFDGRTFSSIAELGPEIQSRTIMVNGMSKTWSMTGWRIGYAAGPKEVISAMSKIQSHSTSNAASISQWAALQALKSPGDEIERRVAAFQERRDEIVGLLRDLPGVGCVVPEGSFYVFPSISAYLSEESRDPVLRSGTDLAQYLLEQARVALVPGDAFGANGHIRISFAVSMERIREGMQRITEALSQLTPRRG
jgi:aspartate/methionine/tyrosine aminotransferase